MYKLIFILIILGLPLITAEGLNYYDTFEDRPTINTMNKSIQKLSMTDDMGVGGNTGFIYDIDNDGTNEYINPEYDGVLTIWNHSSFLDGRYETTSKDLGTFLYFGDMLKYQFDSAGFVDNDGDGYHEMAVADYGSTVDIEVWEWTGSAWQYTSVGQILGGYSRTTPEWCDIDNDGDMDIFHCEYSGGECKLFTYNAGSYTQNFTIVFSGEQFHYNTGARCGDLDNDGNKDDIGLTSYTGKWHLFQGGSSGLVSTYNSSDIGTIWNTVAIGDFLGNGENLMIVCEDSFPCFMYNTTSSQISSPTLLDSSNDLGSIVYGSGHLNIWNMNGKDYLVFANSENRPILMEAISSSLLNGVYLSNGDSSPAYQPLHIFNDSTDTYILTAPPGYGGMGFSPQLLKKTGTEAFTLMQSVELPEKNEVSTYRTNYQNAYVGTGFYCDDLSGDGNIECAISPYSGYSHYYTLANTTEFRSETYMSPELSLLDIMPSDATRWRNPDDGLVYCINEDRNMIRASLGGGNINSYANVYDDEGTAIVNGERITDGVFSTSTLAFDYQNSADYTNFDSGTDQWFEWNSSVPVTMGQIKYWSYFGDSYNPKSLRVQISDTNCDSPNFKTVFNYSDYNKSLQADDPSGMVIRFIPQEVSCIRVTASGSNYNGASYTSTNRVTELEGYYANNCTFYSVPLDFLGAEIGQDYNVSNEIYELKKEESPNEYFSRVTQKPIRTDESFITYVVDKIIEVLVQW